MPASELKELEENAKAYDAALQSANLRPLTFTLKVAEDTYNDETRIKKSVNRQACCPPACAMTVLFHEGHVRRCYDMYTSHQSNLQLTSHSRACEPDGCQQ